jgi:hypothetical protein
MHTRPMCEGLRSEIDGGPRAVDLLLARNAGGQPGLALVAVASEKADALRTVPGTGL